MYQEDLEILMFHLQRLQTKVKRLENSSAFCPSNAYNVGAVSAYSEVVVVEKKVRMPKYRQALKVSCFFDGPTVYAVNVTVNGTTKTIRVLGNTVGMIFAPLKRGTNDIKITVSTESTDASGGQVLTEYMEMG